LTRGLPGCMAFGMATTKVTVTLDDEQLAAVQKLVATGKARNVSSFVRHAVGVSLADVAGWGAMLGLALEHTGGPLTRKERQWADSILKAASPSRRRRKAA
jgi:Arc/MetJ-type ribon-helix-helix transcriptional regulator